MSAAALLADLEAALGAANVAPSPPLADSTGRELGRPLRVVYPADAGEVAAVVRACRKARTTLVPVGTRTAYWSPLSLDGAVAVDVSRLRQLRFDDGVVRAGAGWPVRLLDVELRARGLHLPLHPDAFGGTTLAAMAATACTSGIGMGAGTFGAHLGGVEWVSGTGDVAWTGAAARPGVTPFLRDGLPDLTGLLLGSEGGLGVVTELALLRRPAPWRVRLSGRSPDAARLFPLARNLAGAYDTFRAERNTRSGSTWEVDVWVASTFSAREAAERAVEAAAWFQSAGVSVGAPVAESEAARAGRSPDYDARWNGPVDGLDAFLARAKLRGVDVNAPWSHAGVVLDVLERLAAAHVAAGVPETRLALYAHPDFVNLGAHATLPPGTAWRDADDEPFYDMLLALPVVPYRVGTRWPRRAVAALGGAAVLQAVKAACDPDGILAPGVGPWS
jgi:FAD/FMN-containing dehydrogenase